MQCFMLLGQRCIGEGDSCDVRFRRVNLGKNYCAWLRIGVVSKKGYLLYVCLR